MSNIFIETTSASIISEDGVNLEFKLAFDSEETSNQPLILVHAYINGELVGTPIRFKNADGRIAADLPSLNGEFFIIENGHITNG